MEEKSGKFWPKEKLVLVGSTTYDGEEGQSAGKEGVCVVDLGVRS